ncbi:MAG: hypothetical protein PHC66_03715 [Candidatus Nanoarchaeia archaeon]|nr:hypothetical protein [Candidatus Nanoarchaeia archaeon]MDD5239202.1 hypothetical protein [Candidatus Nanoarchaeia archaeon]
MKNKKAMELPMSTIIVVIIVIIVLVAVGIFFFMQFSKGAGQIETSQGAAATGIEQLGTEADTFLSGSGSAAAESCKGTGTKLCSIYNDQQANCLSAYCTWNSGSNTCSGTISVTCSTLTTQTACTAVTGCSWS